MNTEPQTSMNTEPQIDTTDMPAVKPAPNAVLTVTTVLMMAYVLIALAVLSGTICSYIRFTKKIRRHRTRANMEELYTHVGLCGDALPPRLYRSAIATTPMLIGIFKPEIILPDREYTDAQIQSVLMHEITHLRRRDVLVKWLSVIACALHWFNPLVWLARREIDRVCELSCDEAVIRKLDQAGKRSYGETLISVAANTKASRAVLSTTMCEEKEVLKERLDVIMKYQKRTWVTLAFSTVLILLALCAVCLLGAGVRTTSAPDDNMAAMSGSTPGAITSSAPDDDTDTAPEPTPEAVTSSAQGGNADIPVSSPTQSVAPSGTPAAAATPPSGEVIEFEDPAVEKAIRATLEKPEGPVTEQDMLEVVSLTLDSTYGWKVKTLEDLRWCENLMHIVLQNTEITDISVLKGLQKLWTFECMDPLDDYTPLLSHKDLRLISLKGASDRFFRKLIASCSNLKHVYLYQSDVSAKAIRMLADKFELRTLVLDDCGITDVSPFAAFTGLMDLSLENNLIEDISPFAENPKMCSWLNLRNNKISDWSPLENMTSLQSLCVQGNPVTESAALDLLARKGRRIS